MPGPGEACPDCGGALRLVGEEISEILAPITARLKVVEMARPKTSCRRRARITQLPAPSRPIPRSLAGPGLPAHVLVSRFDDHLPLHRPDEMFARRGAVRRADRPLDGPLIRLTPASTLVDWCGQGLRGLAPLVERIRANVMASDRLQADDAPVRAPDPSRRIEGVGKGVTGQGRDGGSDPGHPSR